MPEHALPSRAVVLAPKDRTVNELERQLRDAPLPVIGRIEDNYLLLDLRTVNDDEIVSLGDCLLAAFA
jgi:L-seryl-tRNA(Ser) seleniumtransferase